MLGYTEAELRVRGSGYQFIHAADMLHCAENHVRSKSQLLPTATSPFALENAYKSYRRTLPSPTTATAPLSKADMNESKLEYSETG